MVSVISYLYLFPHAVNENRQSFAWLNAVMDRLRRIIFIIIVSMVRPIWKDVSLARAISRHSENCQRGSAIRWERLAYRRVRSH